MPFRTNASLPDNVRSVLPENAQSIWRNVFNTTESDGASEQSSIRQAWGAVRNAGYRRVEGQRLYQRTEKAWDPALEIVSEVSVDMFNKFLESSEGKQILQEIINKQKYKDGSSRDRRRRRRRRRAMRKQEFEVMKVNEELGLVFGFGIICKECDEEGCMKDYYDLDNQHIPENVMIKGTTEFMLSDRINNNQHTSNDVGVVVHSFPLTEDIAKSMGIDSAHYGWMVGVKPDADTLEKFRNGEYKGFSIEGRAAMIDEEEA